MDIRKSRLETVELMTVHNKLTGAYQGRTVLVTGHTGFKGSWLTLWLESLGAKVIGYGLDPPTDPSFFQVTGLSDRILDIRGEILDRVRISNVIKKYRPEYIFHLAAQPLVRLSYQHPLDTFNVNVLGTAHILESLRKLQYPVTCVCITSDKCYANRECDYAYREDDPLGGYDPYSASKAAAELVIASYRKSFFSSGDGPRVSVSSVRAGNIIGGGTGQKTGLSRTVCERSFRGIRLRSGIHGQSDRGNSSLILSSAISGSLTKCGKSRIRMQMPGISVPIIQIPLTYALLPRKFSGNGAAAHGRSPPSAKIFLTKPVISNLTVQNPWKN